MKTKAINQLTSALLAMFVIIMFAFSACSSDDSGDDPPAPDPIVIDQFTSGYTYPAGDYPSLVVPTLGNDPTIGEPILAFTAKHVGNFNPEIRAIEANDWYVWIRRNVGLPCADKTDDYTYSGTYWSNSLPLHTFEFVFPWTSTCSTSKLTNFDGGWPLTALKRFKLMELGVWNKSYLETNNAFTDDGHSYTKVRKFHQVEPHPDLYISMHRDWIYEKGNDLTRSGEGTRTISTTEMTGTVLTQITSFTETLEVGVGAQYADVSASINQTFSNEFTEQVEFTEFDTDEITDDYYIPANETWRFIGLNGVERYSFTDSNGNPWESDHLVTDGFEILQDHVKHFLMIVKFKDNSASAYDFEMLEIEDIDLE